jgi:hypothetical protein
MLMHIGELFLKPWLHSKVVTVKTKKIRPYRLKENSTLPNLGKQEVKPILLCPAWASKK